MSLRSNQALWMRKASTGKCRSTGDWLKTLQEQDAGWLHGPFTEAEVTKHVGSECWLAIRRFPLQQRDKVRLIDDGLASGLNSAYGIGNKLKFQDVDALISLVLCIMKAAAGGTVRLHLSCGECVKVTPSPAWRGNFKLLSRTLDLTAAYKQLAAFCNDSWNRHIVVHDPDSNAPAFFRAAALMFGSTSAVYGFNRVSKSLWHIGAHLLSLWHTCYFDDYPSVELEEVSCSARDSVGKYAAEGQKAKDYAGSFDVLGMTCAAGSLTIKNKASRVQGLLQVAGPSHTKGANRRAWPPHLRASSPLLKASMSAQRSSP